MKLTTNEYHKFIDSIKITVNDKERNLKHIDINPFYYSQHGDEETLSEVEVEVKFLISRDEAIKIIKKDTKA